MNKKIIQDFQKRQRDVRLSPDPLSLSKISYIKDSYVKRDDLAAFKKEFIDILSNINRKVDNLNTDSTNKLNESKFQLSQSINKLKNSLQTAIDRKLESLESEIQSSSQAIEGLKSSGTQNIDEVLKKINFPVQRSVNIPVPIDQGGTGVTTLAEAKELFGGGFGGVFLSTEDGVTTSYPPSSDSDSSRGLALLSAVAAHSSGDTIIIGPGTYAITSTITPLAGVSIIGIGFPTIYAPSLGSNVPAITVNTTNITIEGIRVQSNVTCIGHHSATPATITGLTIRNVECTVTDNDANALMFSESSGGGNTEHTVTANIYNSRFIGGTTLGYGIHMALTSSSEVNIWNCEVYGATDGILNKNAGGSSTGVTNIFGGNYESLLDAITSGGTGNIINVYGARARGDQADIYGDDGTVNVYWADFRPDMAVGNGLVTNTIPLIVGHLIPYQNNGGGLGTTSYQWSDLFLANGSVINFSTGDVTLTHSPNTLTFAGASSGYRYDAAILPNSNDGAAVGSTSLKWSDIFLASGAVINFNSGNMTITHAAGVLTVGGGNFTLSSGKIEGTINSSSIAPLKITQSNNTLDTPVVDFNGNSNTVSFGGGAFGPEVGGAMNLNGYIKIRVNGTDNEAAENAGLFLGVFSEECVTGDTLIDTPIGNCRIDSISVGDIVYSINPLTRKKHENIVEKVLVHKKPKRLMILNETTMITPNHPVWSSGGWIRVENLKVGSWIMNHLGEKVWVYSLVSSDIVPEKTYTLTMKFKGLPSYIANGLVVHNKCPFLYFYDITKPGEEAWVYQNTFLYMLDDESKLFTQRRKLRTISNSFVIRELEPETSYIRDLSLIAMVPGGEKKLKWINRPTQYTLIVKQGEVVPVEFEDIPEGTTELYLEATGHYKEN